MKGVKLLIDGEKIWCADIYGTLNVFEGEYLEDKDVWVANKLCEKAVPCVQNEEALVLELKNKKFIDLAEVKGVADYLFLSTCAKLNIDNDRLLTYFNWENCEYKPGKKYVKYLKFFRDVKSIELKEVVSGSELFSLKELTTKAQTLRKKQGEKESGFEKQ